MLKEPARDTALATITDISSRCGIEVDIAKVWEGATSETNDGDEETVEDCETETVEVCGTELNTCEDVEVQDEPPDGGRGWYVVVAALVILMSLSAQSTVFQEAVTVLEIETLSEIDIDLEIETLSEIDIDSPFKGDLETMVLVNENVNSLFGVFTGILIVALNYRVVGIMAALLNLGVYIVSAFVRDFKALIFFCGACTAVGNNMLAIACMTAVLEHFRKRRMLAVILPMAASTIVSLIFQIVAQDDGFTDLSSRILLTICGLLYLPCLFASFFLRPINLFAKTDPQKSLRGYIVNVEGLGILKSPYLYMVIAMCFLYSYGQNVPFVKLENVSHSFHFATILLLVGKLFGSLLACFFSCSCCCGCFACCRKSLTVTIATRLMAVNFFLLGALMMSAEAMAMDIVYAIFAAFVMGCNTGIVEVVITAAVPLLLGERYLGVSLGLVDCSLKTALLVSSALSDEIQKGTGDASSCFYVGGAAVLLGCFLVSVLHYKRGSLGDAVVSPLRIVVGQENGSGNGIPPDGPRTPSTHLETYGSSVASDIRKMEANEHRSAGTEPDVKKETGQGVWSMS